ncbi:MAG TPA: hypothetical protein VK843_14750 [Planctomycetota bacterium]|nr:hypothetical protein [Planctomycetota bacterium]
MFSRALTMLAIALTFQVPELTESNFAQWRDTIRPKASELTFEDCDWKPTFWEAVVQAQAQGKPILLWAMNGHPMACT